MKRLLILSGKGGTGKTTTAAAFIAFSKCRAMADCDVDAPNLHLVTAADGPPEQWDFVGADKAAIDPVRCVGCGTCAEHCRFNAIQVRDGRCTINEYTCEGCGVCAYVCPHQAIKLKPDTAGTQFLFQGETVFSSAQLKMGRGNSGKLVTNVKLTMLQHAPETDLAIIDGSPGIGCPVIASVSGTDLVLVVTEPSLSGLSDLQRLVKTAATFQTKLAVCVNKWDTSPENTRAIESFCTENRLPFVGKIPYDKAAIQAVNQGKNLSETDSPASRALRQVFKNTMKII